MSDYSDIANLSWDELQEPKPAPRGSYLLKASNAVHMPSREEGKSDRVMFVHGIKEAMDDVSTDELQELGEDYDLTENKVFTTLFIEDASSWFKVKRILEAHGVETTGKILEDLKKVKGHEVIGFLEKDKFKKQDGSYGENNKVTEWGKVGE